MKVRVRLTGLVVVVFAGILAADASERLTLRVTPTVGFAPSNLTIRARVASHDENRAIVVIAESEDFYRSSEITVDGRRAPLVSHFEFRGLPGGVYTVHAILRGAGGKQLAHAQSTVKVVDSAFDQQP